MIGGAKAWQDSSGGSRRLQLQTQTQIQKQIQTQIQASIVYDRRSKGLARLKWWEQEVTNYRVLHPTDGTLGRRNTTAT